MSGARPRTSTHKANVSNDVVVANVTRGNFVESEHHGSVVITNPDGSPSYIRGNIEKPILPRSSNKPIQALAMVQAGLELPPQLLALVCASHSGEPFHIDAARAILARFGLSETDLQNIPDLPSDAKEHAQWIKHGFEPSRLAHNCSGKHAGMLATCVINGWDTKSYRNLEHPLQQHITSSLITIASDNVAVTVIDGCGAPAMSLSLRGLATAFGRLAAAPLNTPEGVVAKAMRTYPAMVGGNRRDVSELIRLTPGLIAKDGAEAVYAVGLPDGRGIAVKITDGSQRARPVVMAALLKTLEIQSEAISSLEYSPVYGHRKIVGSVVAVNI